MRADHDQVRREHRRLYVVLAIGALAAGLTIWHDLKVRRDDRVLVERLVQELDSTTTARNRALGEVRSLRYEVRAMLHELDSTRVSPPVPPLRR